MGRFTLGQRIFIFESYTRNNSARVCQREFGQEFPGVEIPSRSTIHQLVRKFKRTGSILDKKADRRNHVLTEKKLAEIAAILEHSPGKSLRELSQQVDVSVSSARNAAQVLKLRSKIMKTNSPQTFNENRTEIGSLPILRNVAVGMEPQPRSSQDYDSDCELCSIMQEQRRHLSQHDVDFAFVEEEEEVMEVRSTVISPPRSVQEPHYLLNGLESRLAKRKRKQKRKQEKDNLNSMTKEKKELEAILLHLKQQKLVMELDKLSEERELIAVKKRNIALRSDILDLHRSLSELEGTATHFNITAYSKDTQTMESVSSETPATSLTSVRSSLPQQLPRNQDPLAFTYITKHAEVNNERVITGHAVVSEPMPHQFVHVKTETIFPEESLIIPPVTVASDEQKEPANEQTACNNIDSGHTLSCKENGCTAWSEPYFKDLDKKPPSQTLFPDHMREPLNVSSHVEVSRTVYSEQIKSAERPKQKRKRLATRKQ